MFTVSAGETQMDFEKRSEAIEKAKEVSSKAYGKVLIEDHIGREQMTYRNGELEFYVYETRPSRLRSQR